MGKNTIYNFKLVTGEEFITRLISEDENTYVLDRPRNVMLAVDPSGRPQLQLAPVTYCSDDEKPVVLNKSAVVCISSDIREQMGNSYIESVSKIAIPQKKIILG